MGVGISPAPPITKFGLKMATSKRAFSPQTIPCKSCQQDFTQDRHCQIICATCSAVTKPCQQCGNPFTFKWVGETNNAKRRFCGNVCAATWRNSQPGVLDRFNKSLEGIRGVVLKGRKSPESSVRMTKNNPMKQPKALAKMKAALKGRTFLARGGNSQITPEQQTLADLLGLPMEHAILTRPAWGEFPSLPNCYKVDLASPDHMLAIEVDGNTHKLKKWKFLDHRKTSVLNFLGWRVLRFWNQEVRDNPQKVVEAIRLSMTSK